jgi:hemerythrin
MTNVSIASNTAETLTMAIVWNAQRMATGVEEVDEQHKTLIRHFNEFHEAMAHGKGRAAAIRLVGFLADYTERHFACEEKCMAKYQCSAAAANLAAHNSLRQEIARLRGLIKDDKLTIRDLVKVEQTMGAWIQDHICSVDIHLRDCVKPAP